MRIFGKCSLILFLFFIVSNLSAQLNYDLQAVQISGNESPYYGSLQTYDVEVTNLGLETAQNFSISLYGGTDNFIASQEISALSSGATSHYDFTFQVDYYHIPAYYAIISYSDDEDITNNTTPNFLIEIELELGIAIVGDGYEMNNKMPACYYYKNSLVEQLYCNNEFIIFPQILRLCFYYNFVEIPTTSDLNIWIGETNLDNLSDGFIPADQLSQVYSGPVEYQVGSGEAWILLDTPYNYFGGNLVVLVERPLDLLYNTYSNYFYCTSDDIYQERTIYRYSDTEDFDPYNPPSEFNLTNEFANTGIFSNSFGMGQIHGYVTSDNLPIGNVAVNVIGNNYTVYTDADGYYSAPHVPEGDVDLKFSKYGFEDIIVENIYLESGGIIGLDVVLTALPMNTVTFDLSLNNDNSAEGAEVTFTSNDYPDINFTLSYTDNEIADTIQVFAGEYNLQINLENCEEYSEENIIIEDDTSLEITLISYPTITFELTTNNDTSANGAEIILISDNDPATGFTLTYTDDGNADILIVPAGEYSTLISLAGYLDYLQENTVINEDTIISAQLEIATDIDETETNYENRIYGNSPNPFNLSGNGRGSSTTITFSLKNSEVVLLEVYNIRGQLVKSLVNEEKRAGINHAIWNGKDESNQPVSSGIYFYRIQTTSFQAAEKMIVIK